ncbi:hypothetical protein QF000_004058 [Paraburkholderia atlantica]|uniref:Uncharacterized protein n=1 Tax=Paraburkholderia atlantica TaxID=2654982 RepID=A0A7W8Q030_PARAM|nr:hypothetical protein [Paraburkholderia atlantica]MBB5420903.1 hypothetical protein [Paraburkholderia atlantica]MBB5423377.1 hypothetical protein [Paraburkholderia atlantica]
MNKDFLVVFSIIAAVVLIVISTSTIFFARHLRFYDYGPPLGAGLITLAAMLRAAMTKR